MKTRYRLRRSADFRAVSAERRGASDQFLRVGVRANSVGHPRLGLSVSRRLGGAVQRNRLRRQLRAAAAARLDRIGSFDVVIQPWPSALGAGGQALGSALERCLKELGASR